MGRFVLVQPRNIIVGECKRLYKYRFCCEIRRYSGEIVKFNFIFISSSDWCHPEFLQEK